MKLPRPPKDYDEHDQGQLRAALEAADGQNLKRGRDVDLSATSVRLFATSTAGITAHAGGGQASATKLTAYINYVQTVTTAADSIKLTPALAGLSQVVVNRGGNATQVFGNASDTINEVATATGVSQANNTVALYVCPLDGHWFRHLSA